jgi:hypothetical protein
MTGPFETESEAHQAAVQYTGQPDATVTGQLAEANQAMLLDAIHTAGVQPGDYDRRIIGWLAEQPSATCAVVASLIARASEPGAGAKSPGTEQRPGPARH